MKPEPFGAALYYAARNAGVEIESHKDIPLAPGSADRGLVIVMFRVTLEAYYVYLVLQESEPEYNGIASAMKCWMCTSDAKAFLLEASVWEALRELHK